MRRTLESNARATHLIEGALHRAIDAAAAAPSPPRLGDALRYAVFPGGARIRPRLCLAVADACGGGASPLVVATAVAIELYHCASLALDDLPCFDDAAVRRDRPALHRVFGDAQAILVSSGLIVLASQCVMDADTADPDRRRAIQLHLLRSVGTRHGLVAGQAWEHEAHVNLAHYHSCKTASLFAAASYCGALASGCSDPNWALVGRHLGLAYQISDDLADLAGDTQAPREHVGHRPHGGLNVVVELGSGKARRRLRQLLASATRAVPSCQGRRLLKHWLRHESGRVRVADARLLNARRKPQGVEDVLHMESRRCQTREGNDASDSKAQRQLARQAR